MESHKRAKVQAQLFDTKKANGTVAFEESFESNKFRLFELPENLARLVENGCSLQLKGSVDGSDVVLCSENQTYSIKRVETSNSAFLVPPINDLDQPSFYIRGKVTDYYELKVINARDKLLKIRDVLETTQYRGYGEEMNGCHRSDLMTYEEFVEQIQASDEEIKVAMATHRVLEIDGKIRQIAKDALLDFTRDLLDTIIENSWSLSAISEQECGEYMSIKDPVLLSFSLKYFGEVDVASGNWLLDFGRICRESAHHVFISNHSQGPAKGVEGKESGLLLPCDYFLEQWQNRTPKRPESYPTPSLSSSSVTACVANPIPSAGTDMLPEEYLNGIALKEEYSGRNFYRYLPLDSLPPDPQGRFNALFAVRAKYQQAELEPYLRDLYGGIGQPKTIQELLLNHTRRVEERFFVAK